MKILWISYYFYPFSGVGPNKNTFLIEELEKDNDIMILSTTPNKLNVNLELLQKDKKNFNIIRIPSIDNQLFFSKLRNFFKQTFTFSKNTNSVNNIDNRKNNYGLLKSSLGFIDYQNSWYFIWKIYKYFILKKIKKFNPDVIYVSAPPFSGILIGKEIKKELKKPLVVEYRDLWTGSHHYNKHNLIKKTEYKIEKKISKNIDLVLFATEGIAKKYSRIFKKDYRILYNFFIESHKKNLQQNNIKDNTIKLAYSGTL